MKAVFYAADKPLERRLAQAVKQALYRTGDTLEIRSHYEEPTGDIGCTFGVKSGRAFLEDHWKAGRHTLFFDKAYLRASKSYIRVAADSFHPLAYFGKGRTGARFAELASLQRRKRGQFIILAGSSQKYCGFHGLGDATDWARKTVALIKQYTDRPILYRPKPSWKEAVPIPGTVFSRDGLLSNHLPNCHALVTHGSNAALEAILAGVPAICLGESIADPVAEKFIESIEDPFFPDDAARTQWAYDVAHCQWTNDEWKKGLVWPELRDVLTRA